MSINIHIYKYTYTYIYLRRTSGTYIEKTQWIIYSKGSYDP